MFRPSSHASPWNSCVSAGSAMSSVALAPTTCAPMSVPLFASATIFTKPAVSPWMIARPRAVKGNLPTFTSRPASRACFSVRPTDAICGCEYVQRVTSAWSVGDQQLASPHLTLLGVDAHPVAGLLGALHLHADAAVDAGLLESAEHLFGHVLVLERHQPVERLEQRDLDAELVVQRRELHAYRARSDDADRLRDLVRKRQVVGRDDVLAVELDARQRLHRRARGDDQVLGFDLLSADLDGAAVAQAPVAGDDLDLVLLHQVLHALVQLEHDGVAPGGYARVVERDALRGDAELLPADRHPVVQLRRFQQRLGRDAPDV